MIYLVVFTESAEKELAVLPKPDYKKITAAIDSLAANPFPHGYLKLEGTKEKLFRIRKGNYRIIYIVDHNVITITILKVSHRKDVYRR